VVQLLALDGGETRVLAEQTTVADPQRLGPSAGRLDGGGDARSTKRSAVAWIVSREPLTLR